MLIKWSTCKGYKCNYINEVFRNTNFGFGYLGDGAQDQRCI